MLRVRLPVVLECRRRRAQRCAGRPWRGSPPAAVHRLQPERILVAAAIPGAIFTVTKTVIDRVGARLFERWTGEWPATDHPAVHPEESADNVFK